MRKSVLLIIFLLSTMKCSENSIGAERADCSDKEFVFKHARQLAKKKLGKKLASYQVTLEEEKDFFYIFYINEEALNDPLKKGGNGLMLKISKENCDVVDYKRFR